MPRCGSYLIRAELLGPWDKSLEPTVDLLLLKNTSETVLCTDGVSLKEVVNIGINKD